MSKTQWSRILSVFSQPHHQNNLSIFALKRQDMMFLLKLLHPQLTIFILLQSALTNEQIYKDKIE